MTTAFVLMIVAVCNKAPHDCPQKPEAPRYERSFSDWHSCQAAADSYNGISTNGFVTVQTANIHPDFAYCAESASP